MLASICEIPLHDRRGRVVAAVRVDEDDWFRYARYAWTFNSNGYAVSRLGTELAHEDDGRFATKSPSNKACLLHRLILGLQHGDRRRGDHINRDRLDCRRSNLRVVDGSGNSQNVTKRSGTRSRHRGVVFHRHSGLWLARATVNKTTHHLGYYTDEDQAGDAAATFRAEHMPYSQEALA